MNSENKIKHLEMIQNLINRMASNSFMLKSWAITIAAGVFALASEDTYKLLFLLVPTIMFWCMDSYYLLQEREYRILYNKVRQLKEQEIDFNLDITSGKVNKNKKYLSSLFSKTEVGFYGILFIILCIIVILSHCFECISAYVNIKKYL
jgi:hypothetical protein